MVVRTVAENGLASNNGVKPGDEIYQVGLIVIPRRQACFLLTQFINFCPLKGRIGVVMTLVLEVWRSMIVARCKHTGFQSCRPCCIVD